MNEKLKVQELKIGHQQELIHSSIEIQERERERIAMDLHDDIGAKLATAKMFLSVEEGGEECPSSIEAIRQIKGLLDETIDSSRQISHDLLPPLLSRFGFFVAAEELCKSLSHQGGLRVSYRYSGVESERMEKSVELSLYRILQELLNNTSKHAQAENVLVLLENRKSHLTLSYEDDGIGFKPEQKNVKKGLGMSNIESRTSMIGGVLEFDTTVERGIKVKITLNFSGDGGTNSTGDDSRGSAFISESLNSASA